MKNLWNSMLAVVFVLGLADAALAGKTKSKKKKAKPDSAQSEVQKSEEKELAELNKKSEQLEKAESKDQVVAPDGQALKEDQSVYTRAYRQKLDEANKEQAEAAAQSEKDRARDVQYMKHIERLDSMDRKANKR